jgi:hypothetical protein
VLLERETHTSRRSPNELDMPNPDSNVKRRNWIVLVVLVAVALAVYVSFMVKMASNG